MYRSCLVKRVGFVHRTSCTFKYTRQRAPTVNVLENCVADCHNSVHARLSSRCTAIKLPTSLDLVESDKGLDLVESDKNQTFCNRA